jgi:hypothetical protein
MLMSLCRFLTLARRHINSCREITLTYNATHWVSAGPQPLSTVYWRLDQERKDRERKGKAAAKGTKDKAGRTGRRQQASAGRAPSPALGPEPFELPRTVPPGAWLGLRWRVARNTFWCVQGGGLYSVGRARRVRKRSSAWLQRHTTHAPHAAPAQPSCVPRDTLRSLRSCPPPPRRPRGNLDEASFKASSRLQGRVRCGHLHVRSARLSQDDVTQSPPPYPARRAAKSSTCGGASREAISCPRPGSAR